ncbi:hypothetical protein AF335_11070 [Streptomyces eurocidicus]|uniref:Flagellar biosynthesis component FlhA n=1 Tax=Streptomyces eurocidicus TaxID=66423 RepID=A0A2N8NXE7_STREU|nr:hypothetical protein [Streptomyces eurocidicus]MBB5120462.1 flagellar biosynthesis component FlhA [Streptomyces eurocidicus]MBF6053675.1 hypothetical protein [Streptomyces eurocidicus]PNE33429.1 hypothetical protein AF335_11070 [Streptomyces eurocidicus]
MTTEPTSQDPGRESKHRRAGILAFTIGAAAVLAVFAFLPGLPHVIDWGALLVALAGGLLARRAWQARTAKKRAGKD